jgi:hypothetical protein
MANPDHLDIIKQGVDVWNKWREENYGIEPDLSQADLHELDRNGGYCWIIPEELKIGDKIQHNLEQSTRIHNKLVLVLSQHSTT